MTDQRERSRPAWTAGVPVPVFACVLAGLVLAGCEGAGGGANWFKPAGPPGERWTIRCVRSSAPGHEAMCQHLADAMRKAQGLKPQAVRVRTDATGSSLCYGEYAKVPSAGGGALVFPPEMLQDLDRIRELVVEYNRPFFLAVPECLDTEHTGGNEQWQVSKSRSSYTLQIALFYNTPTFNQRQQAAEEYVQLLRGEGFPAYYVHEPVRSIVFVGDFDESDVVRTPEGLVGYGPRVELLIQRRPEEFRYLTENGFVRRYQDPSGRMQPVPSRLVPVPRGFGGGGWDY